jgi:hypothetical protein
LKYGPAIKRLLSFIAKTENFRSRFQTFHLGIPVNTNKSRTHAVMVSGFVAFDDPQRKEARQTCRGLYRESAYAITRPCIGEGEPG